MSSEVFCGCDYMTLVDARPGSLQCFYNRHCHTRSQIRIFAVGLFSAAPAWFACEVQIWPKHLLTSTRARLQRTGGEDLCDEVRVPGGGECYRLRETGAALGHVTMKYLVVKNRGDAEPRVLDQPLLHCVGKHRPLARAFSFSLSRNLADAVFHDLRCFGRVEVAAID